MLIEVEDNGPGISSENQNRLFEAHFTTKPSDSGTGLGLSISRRLTRAYGGDLELRQSEAYIRTTFEIHLPCTEKAKTGAVA